MTGYRSDRLDAAADRAADIRHAARNAEPFPMPGELVGRIRVTGPAHPPRRVQARVIVAGAVVGALAGGATAFIAALITVLIGCR